MDIRTAQLTDKAHIVDLIYSAGPELYDFLYQTSRHRAQDFIAYEFASGRGFCGYPNVTVAVRGGVAVGTGCFFDGKNYDRLSLQTLRNMIAFYGWREIVPVLLHTTHIGSVMKRPKKDELYLSNFGVAPACRSQGIGRAMLEQQVARAKQQGYRLFALDVAATNPRAQRLYESLGLQMICQKVFSGKRAGHSVPDARKMERIL
jgi:ribosomal protein S18 acetylase RimI-like enzyme